MRLRGGVQPYSGYLEVSYSDEWGFVCDSGSWTMAEANIVCKQLGFGRGIRSTTQGKVEKILKGSLVLIPSPSPSVKIKIMGGKICLRSKGKTLLGDVNKLFVFKSLLTTSGKVLPLHLKQTFTPII